MNLLELIESETSQYASSTDTMSLKDSRDLAKNILAIIKQHTFDIQDIRNAIEFGKDVKSGNAYLYSIDGLPFIDYEDTTIQTERYIEGLSLSKDCL